MRDVMGRMDGDSDGVAMEIADPHGRIAQLELEIQRLEEANHKVRAECAKWYQKVCAMEHERDKQAEQANSIVGRGYRSVTVYPDGTVEVDRSSDDDQPASARRTL